MSTGVVFQEPGAVETRQERAERRARLLRDAFQSVFEVLAVIYRDEDWRYINDLAGRPYIGFTAFVQDQLGCVASNARRYQQGIVGLVLPLQDVALPGTRIPVTSSDVARLGVAGARVVVEEAPAALDGVTDPAAQTDVLRELIDTVTKRSTDPGFGPVQESTTPTPTVSDTSLGSLVPAELPHPPTGVGNRAVIEDAARPPADDTEPGTFGQDLACAQPGPMGDHIGAPPVHSSASDHGAEAASFGAPVAGPSEAEVSGDGGGTHDATTAALEAAIAAVVAAGDPAALAQRISSGDGPALASRCVAAGQRLVRLGQLLRTVA